MGNDPLAIYKPSGAKSVDAAKAMANFTGWSYAAVNAIASEVANIQFRLYQIKGDDEEELNDHALLTLLEGVNETMTGSARNQSRSSRRGSSSIAMLAHLSNQSIQSCIISLLREIAGSDR